MQFGQYTIEFDFFVIVALIAIIIIQAVFLGKQNSEIKKLQSKLNLDK